MSDKIVYSRERLREELLRQLREVFAKKGLVLDLENSAFGTFAVNILTALVGDLFVYSNFLYGESSLVTAQLINSIYNWSTYIDYTPRYATPAVVDLTFYFPYENVFVVEILPYEHSFTAGNISFTIDKPIRVENTTLGIYVKEIDVATNSYTLLPYEVLYLESGLKVFSFTVRARNIYIKDYEMKVPNLRPFQLHDISITLQEGEELVDLLFFVDNVQWVRKPLVLSLPSEKVFDVYRSAQANVLIVRTGNDIYGQQLRGDNILVRCVLCNGELGNVQTHTINKGPVLTTVTGESVVEYYVTNKKPASGGTNAETTYEIKANAPISLRLRYRNVSQQDFDDELSLYSEVKDAVCLLKRSDNVTNDVYIYLLLDDFSVSKRYVYSRTSTITIDITEYDKDYLEPFTSTLTSIAPFDEGLTFTSPFLVLLDLERDTWYGFLGSLEGDLKISQVYNVADSLFTTTRSVVTSVEYKIDIETKSLVVYVKTNVQNQQRPVKQKVRVRRTNGIYTESQTADLSEGQNEIEYTLTFSDFLAIQKLHLLEVITYELDTQPILNTVYSSPLSLLRDNVEYGWIVRDTENNKIYAVDIPVLDKRYSDVLSEVEKKELLEFLMSLYSKSLLNEQKRMLNTRPHIRFVRTCGKLNNVHFSEPDVYVMSIVNSFSTAQSLNLSLGQKIAITDPVPANDPFVNYAGCIATYIGNDADTGLKIFDFERVSQSTIIRSGAYNYVLVDTRWKKLELENPLTIEVDIFVDDPSSAVLNEKYKQSIKDYINKKRIEERIGFSHMVRYLMDIPGTIHVRVVEPKHDVLFSYDRKELLRKPNKMLFLTYVMEKVFTTDENIIVNIKSSRNL